MVFAAANHQSTLAVMGGWLRLVVCVVDCVAEIGVCCGGAAAMIWRDGRWRGEWPAVGKSLTVGAIESCRGFWLLLGTPDLPSGEGGGDEQYQSMNSTNR